LVELLLLELSVGCPGVCATGQPPSVMINSAPAETASEAVERKRRLRIEHYLRQAGLKAEFLLGRSEGLAGWNGG
jgi:hypothetical protein